MTKVEKPEPAKPSPEDALEKCRRDEESLTADIDDLEDRTSPARPEVPPIGSMF